MYDKKLSKSEEEKESRAIESIHSYIELMSPHQLDFLSTLAWALLDGRKIKIGKKSKVK